MPLGPVPQFFSEQPDKSLEELKKSPEFAFGCLQALVSKLVERGELSRQACFKITYVGILTVSGASNFKLIKNKFYFQRGGCCLHQEPLYLGHEERTEAVLERGAGSGFKLCNS